MKDKKIKELLNFDSKNDDKLELKNIFNQKISEFLIYFCLQKQNIVFDVETNKNKNNNTNVDVSFEYDNFEFNIEVKCPGEFLNESNKIKVSSSYRFTDNNENEMIIDYIISQLNSNSTNKECEIAEKGKLADNKVKDCLVSANEKFDSPNLNKLNILFLCTSDICMGEYWKYFQNFASGFLLKNTNISYFNLTKDGVSRDLQKSDYDKVSIVVLSNGISLNQSYNSKSWDLFNSNNIILINQNCSSINENAITLFSSIFPHRTNEYLKMIDYGKKIKHNNNLQLENSIYDFCDKYKIK